MSKKIIFVSVAALIFIGVVVYSVLRTSGQQISSTKYSQLPSAEFLFTGPPNVLSINWSISDKITIQGIDFGDKNQPVYIGNISSHEISPFLISGEPIVGYSPTISPDGQYLAFAYNGISIVQIEESIVNERHLSYTTLDLAWSHDSKRLAFTSIDQGRLKIYIYDLLNDQVQMKFDVPQNNVSRSLCCALAWSADDQKLALAIRQDKKNSTSTQSDIYILILKNDQLVRVTDTLNVNEEFPVWSPREDILLFTSDSEGSSEQNGELVLARGDGHCQMKIKNIHGISSPTWSPDGTKIAFVAEDGIYDLGISSLENEFNSFRKTCNITK